jgi:glycosyltransferase involved in cell wall biosynthesis
MRWPAEALIAQGHDVVIASKPQVIMQGKRIVGLPTPMDADVVVFQRPCRQQYLDMIDILQKQGVKVVIDMDDDLSCIHPQNPAYTAYLSDGMHWKYAGQACEMADLVTVTTPALAEKYGFGKAVTLPNCVPQHYLSVDVVRDGLTVGWAGYTGTHPDDLQVTHGMVNAAIAKKARFMAIGDVKIFDNLGIRNRIPNVYQEGVSIDEYPRAIAQFDIGIVPLETSEFNEAKSWLKALEYAACGVAPVVSPTTDNMRMVREGAAYVAGSPAGWKLALDSLIDSERERKDLTNRAREFASQWTIERNASKWWEAWCTI